MWLAMPVQVGIVGVGKTWPHRWDSGRACFGIVLRAFLACFLAPLLYGLMLFSNVVS
jgi:hypothetical protein